MRIAHVITKLDIGGAQETAVSCAAGLRTRGHEVMLVSGRDIHDAGEMGGEARSQGVPVIEVASLGRSINVMRDAATLVRLVCLLRRVRPDVVHTHSSKAGFVGRLAAVIARVPVRVHTVHGWSFNERMPRFEQRLFVVLERLAARWTHRLVVVTSLDRDKGLAVGIGKPSQYCLIRSGIDLSRWFATTSERDEAPVVGTVARLSAQKDPITLVRAFARVAKERPDTRFRIVGDGPLRSTVVQEVHRLGIENRVELLGARRDVVPQVTTFTVFASASLWEGLPRTVIEAMACGVAVVATGVDGVAEVVRDGETGVLVPPGDSEALGDAILRVLGDPAFRRRATAAALRLVGEFDESKMVDAHERLYWTLLRGAVVTCQA